MAVEYWIAIHPDHRLPGRQHFDPRDIPMLLSSIRLLDVCGRPPRLKARLIGTRMVDFLGRDYTGQWLDEAYPDLPGSAMERDYLYVITTGQPHWRLGEPYLTQHREFHRFERVILPFARDGVNVDMLVTVFEFFGTYPDPRPGS
jgi:hypothetical protein